MTLSDNESAFWVGYNACKAKDYEGASTRKDEGVAQSTFDSPSPKFVPYPFPKLKRSQLLEVA